MTKVDPTLPGAEIFEIGRRDLERSVLSSPALALLVVARRLLMVGIELPSLPLPAIPELLLYERLAADGVADPYSAYNSILRRLSSLAASLELMKTRNDGAANTG